MSTSNSGFGKRLKTFFWFLSPVLLLVIGGYVYFSYYYVFAEGVKAGTLNNVMYKGFIFKTYEGRMIQAGLRSKTPGALQSYDFEFSINNNEVAEKLMLLSGKEVKLHYIEYRRALPWRGFSTYIVDDIVEVGETEEVLHAFEP